MIYIKKGLYLKAYRKFLKNAPLTNISKGSLLGWSDANLIVRFVNKEGETHERTAHMFSKE